MILQPTKICISSNENPDYIQFWPVVASAWIKLGFQPMLALVTDKDKKQWEWMEEFGEVIRFNENPNVPSGNWAKLARWSLYGKYENEISIVSDLDMIPMQRDYFLDLPTEYDPDKHLILKGADAYGDRGNHGDNLQKTQTTEKFPGCYMTAKGSVWRDILKMDKYSSLEEWATQYYDISVYDQKEGVNFPYTTFSEESLMRVVVLRWDESGEKTIRLGRPGGWRWGPDQNGLRIDRSVWPNTSGWEVMGFTKDKKYPEPVRVGHYIDAHLLRPLQEVKEHIYPILDYLDLPRSLIDQGITLSQKMK